MTSDFSNCANNTILNCYSTIILVVKGDRARKNNLNTQKWVGFVEFISHPKMWECICKYVNTHIYVFLWKLNSLLFLIFFCVSIRRFSFSFFEIHNLNFSFWSDLKNNAYSNKYIPMYIPIYIYLKNIKIWILLLLLIFYYRF